jgi:hypothetical protein
MFNVTEIVEETRVSDKYSDASQGTDKLYHMKLYRVHLATGGKWRGIFFACWFLFCIFVFFFLLCALIA